MEREIKGNIRRNGFMYKITHAALLIYSSFEENFSLYIIEYLKSQSGT
jgi:hypothetical protein